MNCKKIITGLRSNFGTTAVYSSSYCDEIIFYLPKCDSSTLIEYKSYDTKNTVILKEYQNHLNDGTPTIHSAVIQNHPTHEQNNVLDSDVQQDVL